MSKVYAVTNPHKLNKRNELVPSWPDLRLQAEEYGEVEFLLSPNAAPWAPAKIIVELYEKLRGFRGDKDYLLLIGNPILIGLTCAVAARITGGRARMLQWNGRDMKYIPVEAVIWEDEEDAALRIGSELRRKGEASYED